MRMQRVLIVVITGALLGTPSLSTVAASETEVRVVGSIGAGGHVSWPGPADPQTAKVEREKCVPDGTPSDDQGPCWTYRLNVTEPGWRLRIGLDLRLSKDAVPRDASAGRNFRVEAFEPDVDPTTAQPLIASSSGSDYSSEFWICTDQIGCPPADFLGHDCLGRCSTSGQTVVAGIALGLWTIRVVPTDVLGWTFDMRAKLEVAPATPERAPRSLLPNLRAMEPFAFTFTAPAADSAYNSAGLEGAPISCTASEYADGTKLCLRFSAGAANHGDEDFRVHPCTTPVTGVDVPACQRIYKSDGSFVLPDRPTGARLVYEDAHGHWHYSDFLTYELFSVTGLGRTKLVETAAGKKTGFCPVDERMAGFSRFFQAFVRSQGERSLREGYGLCFDPARPSMGLSTGWGDYYEWQRPGQFVEFADAEGVPYPDGAYVLVVTADKGNHILETDESDNTSFALICVQNASITLVDHGLGDGPVVKHSSCLP